MDRARGQLLAGARLPINQDSTVGWRGNTDLLSKRPDRNALADHRVVVIELLAESQIVRFELSLTERVAHGDYGAINLKRLFDKVERPKPRRPHSRFDAAVPTDHDDGGLRVGAFQPFKGL